MTALLGLLPGALGWLRVSPWRWGSVAALVAVLAAWWYFAPAVSLWGTRQAERAIDRTLADVEAKDAAIRGLSAKIAELGQAADRAKAQAAEERVARAKAEATADAFAARAGDLEKALDRVRAQRVARPVVRGLAAARDVLAEAVR